MRRTDFNELIDRAAFQELFITEMGWNNPANSQPLYITIDDVDYDFVPVAEKSGFQVYTCTLDVIPTASECKKIDNKLRNYGFDYICIFIQGGTLHHLWLTPVKTNEKRELVKTEYLGGAKADFLFSKMSDLSFELTERVLISDVKQKVQGSFHLNSEKVTKDFYTQFRKEHKAFTKHIVGIENEKDRDWYASVMLNRLMFCYFIQKKGFLDQKTNYLQDKLKWVQEKKGNDQFFETFYQGFLRAMFHDGLNNPRHSAEFEQMYGRIPYLNGGMFDEHQLERENKGIDIADEAFKNLFDFFDKWNWHLDTRLTASGKDINPDVLGYIFEQYINDRAAMGAYYTKEDITEYISKNCIIPFLMDKTAKATKDAAKDFEPDGFVWQMLRDSGDKYIYDAVKKGYSADWQQRIPDYISKGIDTTSEKLLERRSRWNEKTHEEFALPTEIWRETVERLQRCDTLLAKIRGGEIVEINDFITYNLDIRQFCEDLIRQTRNHSYIAHFYRALQNVTILDPTCGSGAFLFAALNILEPLYEACIDRMEEFHSANANLFKEELEEINAKYSSNRQYFIYKSIILRNLYGVDIMVEATEIAKLRLFLKMVAVVEVDKRKDNLGLDPLPDIDFNIKCGNTLVGYATEAELDKALTYGDMFANAEFKEKIETEMKLVATAYNCFRSEQLKTYDDNASIKETKEMLKVRMAKLNKLLNRHMHQAVATGSNYNLWLKNTQPFHWLAEFYQIIKGNGGFDVIIGNPPYVVYTRKDRITKKSVSELYSVDNYLTISCNNLYAYVIERSSKLESTKGKMGMIIPISAFSNENMTPLQQLLKNQRGNLYVSTYHQRPAQLFVGVLQRLCIFLNSKGTEKVRHFSTGIYRWYAETRNSLFMNLSYVETEQEKQGSFVKIGFPIELSIKEKYYSNSIIRKYLGTSSNNKLYYRSAGGGYWISILNNPFDSHTTSNREASFNRDYNAKVFSSFMNSSLFWWYYSTNYDLFNFTESWMFGSYLTYPNKELSNELVNLSDLLEKSLRDNAFHYTINSKTNGVQETVTYRKYYSKGLMDKIDKVLAKHYGFTEEELDFIINYDIKYRMGDELNAE